MMMMDYFEILAHKNNWRRRSRPLSFSIGWLKYAILILAQNCFPICVQKNFLLQVVVQSANFSINQSEKAIVAITLSFTVYSVEHYSYVCVQISHGWSSLGTTI